MGDRGFGKLTVLGLMGVVALFLCAVPAAAEEDDKKEAEWVAKWSNGHKVEKGKQFALKFGGRIQADYQFGSGDAVLGADNFDDGFEFRRARLFFSGTIYDKVEFKAQYDFAGGDADFKDVWIGLKQSWGKIKFGHFKEPFSLEELTSSKYLAFLERSLPVAAFSPSRNSGIGFEGGDDKMNWGVGYFYDADDYGVSSNGDRTNLTGRVVFRPVYEDKGKKLFHIGIAASQKSLETGGRFRFRARPESHFTSDRFVNTDRFAADSALVYGIELAGVNDKLWYAAEYINNDVDAPAFGDPSFGGYYVQAGYFLTDDYRRYKTSSGAFDRQKPSSVWDKSGGSGAWEIAARVSSVDLTDSGVAGGKEDNITLGVNWYPNPATRMMINYVMADVDGVGDGDFILVRWQVDF